jgi:AcrR family transcriptional regulator
MDRPLTKRALRKAATHAAVVDAARRVFAERGYEGATIAEIARKADVSAGTVLNAAPTKIALLNAVMVGDFDALHSDCTTLAESLTSSYRDKVAALLELHLQRHCAELDLISALIGHTWLDGDAEFQALHDNLDRAWTAIAMLTRQQKADGALKPDVDPDTVVDVLQDLYLGVIRRRSAAGDKDLFKASAEMRAGLNAVMGGALA